MKIATYNAASVRARLPVLLEWLSLHEPDVLAIQETKVEDDKFPAAEFEELGYHVAINGQKAWNGVAIVSHSHPQNIRKGFMDELFPNDARIIAAEIDGVQIINTYVPNGNTVGSDKWTYKLQWLERFRRYLDENFRPTDPMLWIGDINIAPKPEDVYDSPRLLGGVGHHPDEFALLEKIVEFGLEDMFRKFESGPGHYTFWDFTVPNALKRGVGWRIDHIYATASMADVCKSCVVDVEPRTWIKPSDHTFVIADFDL